MGSLLPINRRILCWSHHDAYDLIYNSLIYLFDNPFFSVVHVVLNMPLVADIQA